MWHEGGLGLSFSVLPSEFPGAGRRGWFVVGGMFRLVDRLSGYPWSLVEGLVDDQRFVLAGVINRADAEDQMLITLMLTPPLGGQEGLD
jgi:hypothetical protein